MNLAGRRTIQAVLAAGALLACGDAAVIPAAYRPAANGVANQLVAPVSGWDDVLGGIADWYRT